MDLDQVLPRPDVLMSSGELSSLSDDKNFRFLLQSGYEHIQRVAKEQERIKDNEEAMEQ